MLEYLMWLVLIVPHTGARREAVIIKNSSNTKESSTLTETKKSFPSMQVLTQVIFSPANVNEYRYSDSEKSSYKKCCK